MFFGGAFAAIIVSLGVAFYLFVIMGFFGDMPSRRELQDKRNDTASEVYSADSVLLGRYFLYDRTNIAYRDIDTTVIEALVATEDARFYRHHGVDSRSLARVVIKSILLQKESSGGGSTLTQQLIKNLYPRRDYWILDMPINKAREMVLARRLESVYTKPEILELYLNTVSFGGTIFGVERAAKYFFNTTAKKLKPEQAAVLVGMLKATTSYNPKNHPERAKTRRNVVLSQMAKYGYLTPEEADSLKKLALVTKKEKVDKKKEEQNLAPYFREQLRVELAEWCSNQYKRNGDAYNLYTDGLKIYTTLDSKLQREAERAVAKRMASLQKQFNAHWQGREPWGNDKSVLQNAMRRSPHYRRMKAAGASEEEIEKAFQKRVPMTLYGWNGSFRRTMSPMDSLAYYEKFLNTGMVSMEPETGYVRAWVGGINHNLFKYDHVTSKRQVGSTFKPILYAAALEKGVQPCKYIENKLTTYEQFENWSPQNADNKYGGRYSMEGALSNSVNTVSAQLILNVGVPYTVRLARDLGIHSDLPPVPSLALGTADISLLEMVGAYTAFANEGRISEPVYVTKIVDRNGKALRESEPQRRREVLSPDNAAIMLHMMQAVVNEGSGSGLRSTFGLSLDIAGKTGTTQNQTDGWFIGITPGLVTGVWVGGESPLVRFRSLSMGQGSRTALPIWGEFTSRLVRLGYYSKKVPFAPLSERLENRLNCAPYLEDEPTFFDKVRDVLPFNFPTKEERQEKKKDRKERRAERRAERKRNN
ncbi:penicillin-binding protein 1A [Persicitalea jodogahamensis]|uniref:penicillin-binding protein 1A n=1 Tax=Persicitalea jodogahamensis TaxID=402147 RepID=UPI001E3EEF83|nr:transglycosylase domain-containing protein [Persicitalea jodogahamensis]